MTDMNEIKKERRPRDPTQMSRPFQRARVVIFVVCLIFAITIILWTGALSG